MRDTRIIPPRALLYLAAAALLGLLLMVVLDALGIDWRTALT